MENVGPISGETNYFGETDQEESPEQRKRVKTETKVLQEHYHCTSRRDFRSMFSKEEVKVIEEYTRCAPIEDPILAMKWNPLWLANPANIPGYLLSFN